MYSPYFTSYGLYTMLTLQQVPSPSTAFFLKAHYGLIRTSKSLKEYKHEAQHLKDSAGNDRKMKCALNKTPQAIIAKDLLVRCRRENH